MKPWHVSLQERTLAAWAPRSLADCEGIYGNSRKCKAWAMHRCLAKNMLLGLFQSRCRVLNCGHTADFAYYGPLCESVDFVELQRIVKAWSETWGPIRGGGRGALTVHACPASLALAEEKYLYSMGECFAEGPVGIIPG